MLKEKPITFAEKLMTLESKLTERNAKGTQATAQGFDPDRPCRNCGFADNELDENGRPPLDPGTFERLSPIKPPDLSLTLLDTALILHQWQTCC